MVRCFLVFEDGTVMEGTSFGHENTITGEIVFTTSMSGYQESITDPSYRGRIMVSAFPLVGSYGICDRYDMSSAIHVAGLVVKEHCEEPSDMYGGRTLSEYLKEYKVPGISGLDTRDIIKRVRSKGTMNAAILFDEKEMRSVKKYLKKMKEDQNLVALVSTNSIKKIDNGKKVTIGIIDCGIRRNIIGDLSERFNLVVFPYDTKTEDISDSGVSGLIVSNGPGNPGHPDIIKTVVATLKDVSESMPIAGIGLGAQIISLTFGCRTVKMKFGHHGANHPVKHGGHVYITSQNHQYTVDHKSLDGTGLVADQFNTDDGTLEGFSHLSLPVFGIQYEPISPKYDHKSPFYAKLGEIFEESG